MKKRLHFVLGTVLTMMAFSSLTFASEWKQESDGRWWYQHDDGSYTTNNWELINGKYYYFDAQGWMLANTTTPDGKFVGADGALASSIPNGNNTTPIYKATFSHWESGNDEKRIPIHCSIDIPPNSFVWLSVVGNNSYEGFYFDENENVVSYREISINGINYYLNPTGRLADYYTKDIIEKTSDEVSALGTSAVISLGSSVSQSIFLSNSKSSSKSSSGSSSSSSSDEYNKELQAIIKSHERKIDVINREIALARDRLRDY